MPCIKQTRRKPERILIAALVAAWMCWPGNFYLPSARAASQSRNVLIQRLRDDYRTRFAEFAAALAKLADECEKQGLAAEATQIRALALPVERHRVRLKSLPAHVQPKIAADLPPEQREWRLQLRRLRDDYAQDLYRLSRRALTARQFGFAYQLVQEIAQNDPDHEMARRILGYERQGNAWLTPFAAKMLRENKVWHDRFGWLPESHVARYENGERYYGRWRSAAQDAEIHRDFRNAWLVRTEHYLVKTNHSLERGVEIAKLLEEFHDFFIQTFALYFNTPDQLQKLFQSSTRTRPAVQIDPYEVHFYRTRDEYMDRLRSKISIIESTNGLYYTADRVAYFFDDPERKNDDSLYHEATHQLFYESRRLRDSVAVKEHFWVVEGIACYMESFRSENGEFSLGDPGHKRLDNARYRYLVDGYSVPLSRFAAMGMWEFQNSRHLSMNYSQAAGLAHFFMHYDEGRYRDALVEHLSQLYSPNSRVRSRVQSLAELTEVSYPDLDRQYGEYLAEMERALTQQSIRSD